jgi:hypothetical protein
MYFSKNEPLIFRLKNRPAAETSKILGYTAGFSAFL